jgi:MbtH protein
MTNPFEDPNGTYFALVNEEGQYSLWPAYIEVPAGWEIAHPEASRDDCLRHINENWTDMRPKSLIRKMEANQNAA